MAISPGTWTHLAAGIYIALMLVVLAYTLHIANPKYHGYDWFLAGILTYPGIVVFFPSLPNPVAVMMGTAGNTAIICIIGTFFTWI